MSTISLHESFVEDVLAHADASFAKRILKCVFDEAKGQANKSNDHRYKGINDAWIRYVSRGKTAYRLIYILRGDDVLFYRCGNHDVEDHLQSPNEDDEVYKVDIKDEEVLEMTNPLTFLTNHETPVLYGAILRRKLIPNSSVYIVSPFIDPELLYRGSRMGQVLDAMRMDGADIKVITSIDRVNQFDGLWKDLDSRGIEMVFLKNLHSKIYLFITNEQNTHHLSSTPSLGIVGSSNFTKPGISDHLKHGNYESNYSVAEESIEKLEDIAMMYYANAHEYRRAKIMHSKK